MPCYHPKTGYRARVLNPSGKRPIVFNKHDGFEDLPVQIPCSRCIGCKLERSRIWAIRCVHEASLYEDNAFITLTYDQEHLPRDNSLHVNHFQKFMKRLRKKFQPRKIRFFHSGEYGEKYSRPHYHALLFNFDFPDKTYLEKTSNGDTLYESQILKDLWTAGRSTTGAVTFESAAYVARYITKKITGPMAELYYTEIDQDTGEILQDLKPEYCTMSRRPGIGKGWYDKYKKDVYPDDFIVLNGKKLSVPKFYDQQLEKDSLLEYQKIVAKRKNSAEAHSANNTPDRLQVREEIQYLKCKKLPRSFES